MGPQLPKRLIKLSGELYLHDHLFWFIYRPHHYALCPVRTCAKSSLPCSRGNTWQEEQGACIA